MKNKNKVLILPIVLILILGIFWLFKNNQDTKTISTQSEQKIEIKNDFIKSLVIDEIHFLEENNSIHFLFSDKQLNDKYSKLFLSYDFKINDEVYASRDLNLMPNLAEYKSYADSKYQIYDKKEVFIADKKIDFKNINSIKVRLSLEKFADNTKIEKDENWYEVYSPAKSYFFGTYNYNLYKKYLPEYILTEKEKQLKYDLETEKKSLENKPKSEKITKKIEQINYILNV